MQSFQTTTLAYSLACLTSGAVRELMPEADSRKVIKAISGLYILLVVLHGVGDISAEELNFHLPEPESAAQSDTYQTDVLDRTAERLAETCTAALANVGLPAECRFTLRKKEDGTVIVALAQITEKQKLSAEQKQEVLDILRDYAPARILFRSEADAA